MNAKELQEIKERCNKATPEPWCDWARGEIVSDRDNGFDHVLWADEGQVMMSEHDLEFIVNARSDIPRLLSHIEHRDEIIENQDKIIDRQAQEIKRLKEQLPNVVGISGSFDGVTDTRKYTMPIGEYNDLLEKIERLEETLKWYADPKVYNSGSLRRGDPIQGDRGDKARQALKKVRGE
jgi:hypothetical protein